MDLEDLLRESNIAVIVATGSMFLVASGVLYKVSRSITNVLLNVMDEQIYRDKGLYEGSPSFFPSLFGVLKRKSYRIFYHESDKRY